MTTGADLYLLPMRFGSDNGSRSVTVIPRGTDLALLMGFGSDIVTTVADLPLPMGFGSDNEGIW